MCRGIILLNGITQKRVTNEVLVTSPDQANKRGLTTSGESASALEGSAPAYNARRLRSFSAGRFVPSLGAWRAPEKTFST
jgi:hypothetical protein